MQKILKNFNNKTTKHSTKLGALWGCSGRMPVKPGLAAHIREEGLGWARGGQSEGVQVWGRGLPL